MSQFQQEINQMREALSTMESRHAVAMTEAKLKERCDSNAQIARLQEALNKAEKRAFEAEQKAVSHHDCRTVSMVDMEKLDWELRKRTVSMVDMEKLDWELRKMAYTSQHRDNMAQAVRKSLHTISEEELARDVLFPQWNCNSTWDSDVMKSTRATLHKRAKDILSWLANKADPKPGPKVEKAPVVVKLPKPERMDCAELWSKGHDEGRRREHDKIVSHLMRQGFAVEVEG